MKLFLTGFNLYKKIYKIITIFNVRSYCFMYLGKKNYFGANREARSKRKFFFQFTKGFYNTFFPPCRIFVFIVATIKHEVQSYLNNLHSKKKSGLVAM